MNDSRASALPFLLAFFGCEVFANISNDLDAFSDIGFDGKDALIWGLWRVESSYSLLFQDFDVGLKSGERIGHCFVLSLISKIVIDIQPP